MSWESERVEIPAKPFLHRREVNLVYATILSPMAQKRGQ